MPLDLDAEITDRSARPRSRRLFSDIGIASLAIALCMTVTMAVVRIVAVPVM